MNEDQKYWVAMSKINGVGATRFKKLYSGFNTMTEAWQASPEELRQVGLEEKIVANILEGRREINPDEEMIKLEREDIKVVSIKDNNYPKLLREIYDAPGLLYYKGELESEGDDFAIAIVGTRKFSAYGKQVAENLSGDLARQGMTIVSGLALGIDSIAHEAVVKNNCRTISVLGGGLGKQNIYPSSNRYLMEKILATGGLVLSEHAPETMPLRQLFPLRNRVIAGLSVATIVLEAPESSGALITAKYALEYNREVMAVPGNIYNINAVGVNKLIQMGAKLITSAKDVLEALDMQKVEAFIENKKISPDSPEEEIILQILSGEPLHINDIIKQTKLDTPRVNATLVLMEMKGKVKNLGNMNYVVGR